MTFSFLTLTCINHLDLCYNQKPKSMPESCLCYSINSHNGIIK
uniref:Uncharacterized protein n=1 Tax=Rhizophora mucronata TaxID=61149 RepID=A0A2P2N8E2_RHIMU